MSKTKNRAAPALPVQILAVLGYTGFAIPVSIIAIDEFGVLGLALAAFLGWQWTQLAWLGTRSGPVETIERLVPRVDDTPRTSGNASFDAYRQELMTRLETEQRNFEGFLTRLRDAKDRSEFDTFMAEREAQTAPREGAQAS
jgi:hypothetical protein